MITITVSGELEKWLVDAAKEKNMSIDDFVNIEINKRISKLHTMDKESIAKGYEDMGALNIRISEGNAD